MLVSRLILGGIRSSSRAIRSIRISENVALEWILQIGIRSLARIANDACLLESDLAALRRLAVRFAMEIPIGADGVSSFHIVEIL
jgi:hypothetical protein